jgi:membrane protein YdbS with pleckstrin-like domain
MDDLLDWLTWPANLLLKLGAVVASWFVSADVPSFGVIQMMVATLVLAAVLFVIVYSQSLTDYLRSRWKAPHS